MNMVRIVLMCGGLFGMGVVLSTVTRGPGNVTVRAATGGDAARGKVLFEKRCTGCHALDENREGPSLRNVYGRKAGSVPTFSYSNALKASPVKWDDTSLNKWLTDTESLIPNNDMAFRVPLPAERADIIGFLKISSEK